MIFGKRKNDPGFMNEIRCDESSYLIWKWLPKNSVHGENSRENAIRIGSSLRVKDGEVAVFVYNQKDGTQEDFIVGPKDQILVTKNLPVLAKIIGAAYDGGTPFQAEVYFINLAKIVQVKFAVPYFTVFDPRFEDFGVPVSVRGTVSFKITEYREFVKLHRLISFDLEDFEMQIRDAIVRYVKDVITNIPAENNIPVLQIESKIAQINDIIEYNIAQRLSENFGVTVSGVDVACVEIDKTSDEYAHLLNVTKQIVGATVQAEAEAKIRDIEMRQKIEAQNYEEMLRIQREEAQYAQHKQTQSANINAFQIEKQAEVGIAGATALGQMGANGAADVNLAGGDGFNMASIMTSMALGGAIGQNLAGTMNNMMTGMTQTVPENVTPPPINKTLYNVAIDGKPTGPFDESALEHMIKTGQLNKDSLVWTSGMSKWEKACEIESLRVLFVDMPLH